MKKINIGSLELSRICLGGSKFVDMSIDKGKELVNCAIDLGINVVDGHHRYGNAEEVFSSFPCIIRMTKVSAYKDNWRQLVDNSKRTLGKIDIMWISDLDDTTLYKQGVQIYNELKNEFPLLGVTTENPMLAFRFAKEHPECKFFMIPIFIGISIETMMFVEYAKSRNMFIFAIKTFLDKQLFSSFSKEKCVDFVKRLCPDIILIGTSNSNHLKEIVECYGEY